MPPRSHKKTFRISHYSLSSLFVISFAIGTLLSLVFRLINFKGVIQKVDFPQSTPIDNSYLRIHEELSGCERDDVIFTSHPKKGKLWLDQALLEKIAKDVARKMISQTEQLLQFMAKNPLVTDKMYRIFKSPNFVAIIAQDKARLQKSSATFDSESNTLLIFDSSFVSRASLLRLRADLYRLIHQINIFRCRKDGSLFPFFNDKDFFALSAAVSLCNTRRIETWDDLRVKKANGSIDHFELKRLNHLTALLEKYTPKLIPTVLTNGEQKMVRFVQDPEQKKVVEINRLYLTSVEQHKDSWIGWGTFYPADHLLLNESNAIASIYDTMWRVTNFGNILQPAAIERKLKPDEFVLSEHDAEIHMEPEYTAALCPELNDYHQIKFGSCK